MQKKDYYTTSEVAKLLSVAVGSVINWVDDGKLEAIVTPGGHRKIPHQVLINFLEEHKFEVKKPGESKRSIYLVDDEDITHSFFKKIFEKVEDIELFCFHSGTEALIAVGKKTPTMIVVDILMPDIDGIQVIKNIRAKPELNKLFIVAISADITKKEDSLEAGANIFLKKPFNMEDFKRIIVRGEFNMTNAALI